MPHLDYSELQTDKLLCIDKKAGKMGIIFLSRLSVDWITLFLARLSIDGITCKQVKVMIIFRV